MPETILRLTERLSVAIGRGPFHVQDGLYVRCDAEGTFRLADALIG